MTSSEVDKTWKSSRDELARFWKTIFDVPNFPKAGLAMLVLAILASDVFSQGQIETRADSTSQVLPVYQQEVEEVTQEVITLENPTDCLECKAPLQDSDGITVSMMNGNSQLKILGSLSTLTVFSTDRPFAPGLPLFLLPSSPLVLNTNTFDIHGRQSNIGATFIGPPAGGFIPSATFVAFIAMIV